MGVDGIDTSDIFDGYYADDKKTNKYIIKNCPAKVDLYCGATINRGFLYCKDCTDCVMKRIVKKCRRTITINKGLENQFILGKITFAEFILKDLDIQEGE